MTVKDLKGRMSRTPDYVSKLRQKLFREEEAIRQSIEDLTLSLVGGTSQVNSYKRNKIAILNISLLQCLEAQSRVKRVITYSQKLAGWK
jgi:hypothetical protein